MTSRDPFEVDDASAHAELEEADDGLLIHVASVDVAAMSTVGLGQGTTEAGEEVTFAGDHRPMREIALALASGEVVDVRLAGWQIVRVS